MVVKIRNKSHFHPANTAKKKKQQQQHIWKNTAGGGMLLYVEVVNNWGTIQGWKIQKQSL